MNWIGRLDVIVLGLMLAYVAFVLVRASIRFCRAQRTQESGDEGRSLRKLLTDVNVWVSSLKSIACVAPYLGVVGTCSGVVSGLIFSGNMSHDTFLAMTAWRIGSALLPAAAGIPVTIAATCAYNYLCTRLDSVESNVSVEIPQSRSDRSAGRFPLRRRFSQLPGYALIAAPSLAALVAVYTPYFAPREPTGLAIDLASSRCQKGSVDRPIVLHITNAGKLMINTEKEEWSGLAGRLSEIYGGREKRTLFLVADDSVSFQTVAEAIDMVQNARLSGRSESGDITMRWITPEAIREGCGITVNHAQGSR